ncbi:hypothetical protein [Pseudomonas oryziphila]|uniref:Uncharacterized protein n=1 Tax=Pseudomonas oryziphila TaxID=2894079 RepID=A0ABM7CS93_9PSED|nr:hypothetical protein [Pseudomonas oryziphila]AZL74327.1 hypothetical protein EI693_15090 [Pseudomonas oryziphila]
MKKIALIALLAAVGTAQAAHSNESTQVDSPFAQVETTSRTVQLALFQPPPPFPCPEGTHRTPFGHCQPEFDFD